MVFVHALALSINQFPTCTLAAHRAPPTEGKENCVYYISYVGCVVVRRRGRRALCSACVRSVCAFFSQLAGAQPIEKWSSVNHICGSNKRTDSLCCSYSDAITLLAPTLAPTANGHTLGQHTQTTTSHVRTQFHTLCETNDDDRTSERENEIDN